jgi:hypothetical protein
LKEKPVKPTDLTPKERDLIIHAARMGGWLGESYVQSDDREAMYELTNRSGEQGLFRYVTTGIPHRYVLTESGRALAKELGVTI